MKEFTPSSTSEYMNRRRYLMALSTAASASASGCITSIGEGCPSPDLENKLEYQEKTPDALFEEPESKIQLATSRESVENFDSEYLESDIESWARNTKFEQKILLGVQVTSSPESSPLKILGIDQPDSSTVHAHTCIRNQGGSDALSRYAKLIRLPYDQRPPENATLTHWEAGDKITIS